VRIGGGDPRQGRADGENRGRPNGRGIDGDVA
jgi:hypothetical protein